MCKHLTKVSSDEMYNSMQTVVLTEEVDGIKEAVLRGVVEAAVQYVVQ